MPSRDRRDSSAHRSAVSAATTGGFGSASGAGGRASRSAGNTNGSATRSGSASNPSERRLRGAATVPSRRALDERAVSRLALNLYSRTRCADRTHRLARASRVEEDEDPRAVEILVKVHEAAARAKARAEQHQGALDRAIAAIDAGDSDTHDPAEIAIAVHPTKDVIEHGVRLDLSNNELMGEDVVAVCVVVSSHEHITALDVSGQPITLDAAARLLPVLQHNRNLVDLVVQPPEDFDAENPHRGKHEALHAALVQLQNAADDNRANVARRHEADIKRAIRRHRRRQLDRFCAQAEDMFLAEMAGRALIRNDEVAGLEELMMLRHRGHREAATKARLRNLAEVTAARARTVVERETVFRARLENEYRTERLGVTALGEEGARAAEAAVEDRVRAVMKKQETHEWVLARRKEKARWKREAEARAEAEAEEEAARAVIVEEEDAALPGVLEAIEADRADALQRESTRVERQRREAAAQRRAEEQEREKAERLEAQRLAAMARHNLEQTKARDRVEQLAHAGRKNIKTERAVYARLVDDALVSLERPYLAAHSAFRQATVRLAEHLAVLPKVTVSCSMPRDAYDGFVGFLGAAEPVRPFEDFTLAAALPSNWPSVYNERVAALRIADQQLHAAHYALQKGFAAFQGRIAEWRQQLADAAAAAVANEEAARDIHHTGPAALVPLGASTLASSSSPHSRSHHRRTSSVRSGSSVGRTGRGVSPTSRPTSPVSDDGSVDPPPPPPPTIGQLFFEDLQETFVARLGALVRSHTAARVPTMPSADIVAKLKLSVVSSQTFATCLRLTVAQPDDGAAASLGPRDGAAATRHDDDDEPSPPGTHLRSPGGPLRRGSTRAAPKRAAPVDGAWPMHPCAGRALAHVVRPGGPSTGASSSVAASFDGGLPTSAAASSPPIPRPHADIDAEAAVAQLLDAARAKLQTAVAANRDLLQSAASSGGGAQPAPDGFSLETSPTAAASGAIDFTPDNGTVVAPYDLLLDMAGGPGASGARRVPANPTLQPHVTAAWQLERRLATAQPVDDFTDSDDDNETPETIEVGRTPPTAPVRRTRTPKSTPPGGSHPVAGPPAIASDDDDAEFSVAGDESDDDAVARADGNAETDPLPCAGLVLVRPLVTIADDNTPVQSAAGSMSDVRSSMLVRAGTFVRGRTNAAAGRRGSIAGRPAGEFTHMQTTADAATWAPWRSQFPALPPSAAARRRHARLAVFADTFVAAAESVDRSIATAVADAERERQAEQASTPQSSMGTSASTRLGRSAKSGKHSSRGAMHHSGATRPSSAASSAAGLPARTASGSSAAVSPADAELVASVSPPETALEPPFVLGAGGTGIHHAADAVRSLGVECVAWGDVAPEAWTYARRGVVCASLSLHFAVLRPACFAYACANPLAGDRVSFDADVTTAGFRHCSALGSSGLHAATIEAPIVHLTVPVSFRAPWLWVPPRRRVCAYEVGAEKSDGVLVQQRELTCALPLTMASAAPSGGGAGLPPLSVDPPRRTGFVHVAESLTVSFGDTGGVSPGVTSLSPSKADARPGSATSPQRSQRRSYAGPLSAAGGGGDGPARASQRRRRSSASGLGLFGPPPPVPAAPLHGWRLVVDVQPRDLQPPSADLARSADVDSLPHAALAARTCVGLLSTPPISVLSRGRGAGQPKRQTLYVGGLAVADVVEGHITPVVPPASSLASADFRRGDDAAGTPRVAFEFLIGDGPDAARQWKEVVTALRGGKDGKDRAARRRNNQQASGRSLTTARSDGSFPVGTDEAAASPIVTLSAEVDPSASPLPQTIGRAALTGSGDQGVGAVEGVRSPTIATPGGDCEPSAGSPTKASAGTTADNEDIAGPDAARAAAELLVKAVASRLRFWAPDPYEDAAVAALMAAPPAGSVESAATDAGALAALPRAVPPSLFDAAVSLEDPLGSRAGVAYAAFTFRREAPPTVVFDPVWAGAEPSNDSLPNRHDRSVRRIELPLRLPPPPSVLHPPSLPRAPAVIAVRPFDGAAVEIDGLPTSAAANAVHRGGALLVNAYGGSSSREGLDVSNLPSWQWADRARALRVVPTHAFGEVPAAPSGPGASVESNDGGGDATSPRVQAFVPASEDFGLFQPPPLAGARCDPNAAPGNRLHLSLAGASGVRTRTGHASIFASSPALGAPSMSTAGTTASAAMSAFETSGCVVNALGVPVAIYRLPPSLSSVEIRFRCAPYAGALPPAPGSDALDLSASGIESYPHDHRAHGLPTCELIADVFRLIRYRLPAASVSDDATSREERTLRVRLSRGNFELLKTPATTDGAATDESSHAESTTPPFHVQLTANEAEAARRGVPACRPLLWSDFGHFVASLTWALPVVQPTATAVDHGYIDVIEGGAAVRPCHSLLEPHKAVEEVVSIAQLDAFVCAFAGRSAHCAAVKSPFAHDQLAVKRADDLNFAKLTTPAIVDFAASGAFARRLRGIAAALARTACDVAANELTGVANRIAADGAPLAASEAKEVTIANTPVGVCLTLNAVVCVVLSPTLTPGAQIRRKDLSNMLKAIHLTRVPASANAVAAAAASTKEVKAAMNSSAEPKSAAQTPRTMALSATAPYLHAGVPDTLGPTVALHVFVFGASGAPEPTVAPLTLEATHTPEACPLVLASTPLTCVGATAPPPPGAGAPPPTMPPPGGSLVWRRPSCSWCFLHAGGVPLFTPGDSVLAVNKAPGASSAPPAADPKASATATAVLAALTPTLAVRNASAGTTVDVTLEGASVPPLPPAGAAPVAQSDRHGRLSIAFVPVDSQPEHVRTLFSSSRPCRGYRRLGSCSEHDAHVASYVQLRLVPVRPSNDPAAAFAASSTSTGETAAFDIVAEVIPEAGDSAHPPVVTPPPDNPSAPAAKSGGKGGKGGKGTAPATGGTAEDAVASLDPAAWASLAGRSYLVGSMTVYAEPADAAIAPTEPSSHSRRSALASPTNGDLATGDASGRSRSGSGVIIPILTADPPPEGETVTDSEHRGDESTSMPQINVLEGTMRPQEAAESGVRFAARRIVTTLNTVAAPRAGNGGEEGGTTELATRALLAADGHALMRLLLACTVVTTTSPPSSTPLPPSPRTAGNATGAASPLAPSAAAASRLGTPADASPMGLSHKMSRSAIGTASAKDLVSSAPSLLPPPQWTSGAGTLAPRLVVRTRAPGIVVAGSGFGESSHSVDAGADHDADAAGATDRHPRDTVRSKAVFPIDTSQDIGALVAAGGSSGGGGGNSPPRGGSEQQAAAAEEAVRQAAVTVGRSLIAASPLVLHAGVITPVLAETVNLMMAGVVGSSDMSLGLRIELSVVSLADSAVPAAFKDGTVHRPFTWARVPFPSGEDVSGPACRVAAAAATYESPTATGKAAASHRLIFGFSGMERSQYGIRDGNLVAGAQFIAAVTGPHNWSKNPAHALLPIPPHPGPATLSVTFGPQHKTARGKHLADVWKGITLGLMPAEKAGGAKGGRFGMVLAAAMSKARRDSQASQDGDGDGGSAPPTPAATAGGGDSTPTRPSSSHSKPPAHGAGSAAPSRPGSAGGAETAVAPKLAVRVLVEDGGVDPLVAFVPIVLVWPGGGAPTLAASPPASAAEVAKE